MLFLLKEFFEKVDSAHYEIPLLCRCRFLLMLAEDGENFENFLAGRLVEVFIDFLELPAFCFVKSFVFVFETLSRRNIETAVRESVLLPVVTISNIFIDGEPINFATKTFTG